MELLEIEIKSFCDSHHEVIKKLEELGAIFIETRQEIDHYFNHPSRDFKKTDEALRVRVINEKAYITYKGPKLGDQAKTRVEAECSIADPAIMQNILKKLGFVASGCVNKQRTLYKLDKVEICLDDVAEAGRFVELEELGTEQAEIEAKLFDLAEKLGLNRFTRTSYLEMILAQGK